MSNRRTFLKQSIAVAGTLIALPGCKAWGDPIAAVPRVNQAGFLPDGAKYCVYPGNGARNFDVVDASTSRSVHRGTLAPCKGDLGEYCVGDFSAVAQSGTYEVLVNGSKSARFEIAADVYLPAVQRSIGYFAKQRCGNSKTGHHAPCHLDDGKRRDNGQHQDVTGGWHDACDVRKWVSATIYGIIGLSRGLDVLGAGRIKPDAVVEEMRWGNQYFLKMQEPDGYVMDYCGGDDGNNWTDNISGTADDRLIHVDICELPAQFNFIAAQAAMIRHTRDADPAYARVCEAAANRCLQWCTDKRSPGAAKSLGAAVIACAELHRTTGATRLKDLAAGYVAKLLTLQVGKANEPAPRGFFKTSPDNAEPFRDSADGNLPLLALCEAIEEFGDHADAKTWRAALTLHCDHLAAMANHSAFGTVPYGLYAGSDPGGGRRIGPYWYRWFLKTSHETSAPDWWVGINGHLASHGVGLAKAARVLKKPQLAALAQRQLDWIIGVNPFDASTITGTGINQPKLYTTGQFSPPTPLIDGGVMNGIGGSAADEPSLDAGSYNTCEYWTPMVAYTLWLMAELTLGSAGAR